MTALSWRIQKLEAQKHGSNGVGDINARMKSPRYLALRGLVGALPDIDKPRLRGLLEAATRTNDMSEVKAFLRERLTKIVCVDPGGRIVESVDPEGSKGALPGASTNDPA